MKKILFLLLLPALSYAQTPQWPRKDLTCNFLKNEKDEFTGKQVMELGTPGLKIISNGGDLFIDYTEAFVQLGGAKLTVKEGYTLFFKLADSQILELPIGKVIDYSSGGAVAYGMTCAITKEQLEKLATSPVSRYRLNMGFDDKNGDMPARKAKKLHESAQCLKTYLEYEEYKATQPKN